MLHPKKIAWVFVTTLEIISMTVMSQNIWFIKAWNVVGVLVSDGIDR